MDHAAPTTDLAELTAETSLDEVAAGLRAMVAAYGDGSTHLDFGEADCG